MSLKIENWDGANKCKVRLTKLDYIRQLSKKKVVSRMLTFPGTKAFLERMVDSEKLVSASNIVAIQTYEKMSEGHVGSKLLTELLATRKQYLAEMKVWPFNFDAFTKSYTLERCSLPEGPRAKFNQPPLNKLMDALVNSPTDRFNVMDLDFCGIFSEKNAGSVERLFINKVLANNGVLFITHQKGRDVRGGNLLNLLHGYLRNHPIVDFDAISEIHEEDNETKYAVARYLLIPLYYICKAYDNGYILNLDRLIEYRDKNSGSGLAVNMLQYMFKWFDYDGCSLSEARKSVEKIVGKISREEYDYTDWVD